MSVPFHVTLRAHRRARGLSQLQLALEAEVSARHLSCIESGKARAGRAVTYRLVSALGLDPLSAARLSHAAGHAAPVQAEAAPEKALEALLQVVPYPAVVLEEAAAVVATNAAFDAVLGLIAPVEELWARVGAAHARNLRTLTVHPLGLAPYLVNLEAVVAAFDARCRGETPVEVVEHYRLGQRELRFRPVHSRFADVRGGPWLECFVPADAQTRAALSQALAAR
jgi:transcriptional regulator with XRE-family HTH domain